MSNLFYNFIDFTAVLFVVRFAGKKGSAQCTPFIRKKRTGLQMNILLIPILRLACLLCIVFYSILCSLNLLSNSSLFWKYFL